MSNEFKVKNGLKLSNHVSGFLLTVDADDVVVNSTKKESDITTNSADIVYLSGEIDNNTSGISQYHVVYVAKNGNDSMGDGSLGNPYLTVKTANNSISGNNPVNRYVVKVAPGVYTEDNPIQMKDWVSIEGNSAPSTSINALNSTSNLFIASQNPVCGLTDLALGGVTSGYLVEVSNATSLVIRNLTLQESQNGMLISNLSAVVDIDLIQLRQDTGTMVKGIYINSGFVSITNLKVRGQSTITDIVHATGDDSLCSIHGLYSNSNNIDVAIHVEDSADVTLFGGRITGDLSDRMGTALKCIGAGSELDVLATYIQHVDYGLYIDGPAEVDLTSVIIQNCDYGIYSHTTGGESIHVHGGAIGESITFDIYLTEDTCTLLGSGMSVDEDKLFLDSASVYMAHMSTNEGDEGMGIKGELHVGSPERGAESVFGGGDSYTRGLVAYSYNESTSAYVDISVAVKSYSGSTFTFPNNTVGTAIYVASDLIVNGTSDVHQAFGIKMALTTPQSGGTIVAEYWDGSDWTIFNTMIAESGNKYYRKSNQLFTVDAGSYQLRYNPALETDWTKSNDPSHTGSRYFVRYRITSSPSTLPVFEQWKLHTDRTELNADGYNEYMGKARSYVTISVPWSTFQDSASKLGDQDLYRSDNCNAGFKKNEFADVGDSIGTVFTLPSWVDTSSVLKLVVIVVPDTTHTLEMTAWLNSSKDGDTIYTSAPGSTVGEISSVISKAVTAGQQATFIFELDISDKGIEDSSGLPEAIWLNLEASDLTGEVYGMVFDMAFLSWRIGSHV